MGFSGVAWLFLELTNQCFGFVSPVWVLMLSSIRNGWARQVFSASKGRFSLRLSLVSVSLVSYRLPTPYFYLCLFFYMLHHIFVCLFVCLV